MPNGAFSAVFGNENHQINDFPSKIIPCACEKWAGGTVPPLQKVGVHVPPYHAHFTPMALPQTVHCGRCLKVWGHAMVSVELEPITGSGDGTPSGIQGQSPWSGGLGRSPLKLKALCPVSYKPVAKTRTFEWSDLNNYAHS